MADLAQLERALRNADAAGDVAAAQQLAAAIRAQRPAAQTFDPTEGMGTFDKLSAGIGRGMVAANRAVEGLGARLFDDSFLARANRWMHDRGLALRKLPTVEESEAERRDAAAIDAPLLNTTAGKIGNVLGLASVAAPTALIPGAGTWAGAGMIGAGTGALTTEGDLAERAKGAAFGAVGGLGGKALGEGLGAGARWLANNAAQRAASANATAAPRMAAAQAGAREGYVVPPADLHPGLTTELLSGVSGKIKTAQVASQRNQPVTNALARRALGMAPDEQITPDALQALRTAAGSSGYAPVRAAGEVTADKTYVKALDAIAGQYQGAARSFPGAAKNPVIDMVNGLRQQKFDAGDALDMMKVLREQADKAFRSGDTGLGKASKEAAKALEDQLERHLKASGDDAAIAAFRAARRQIARTYSVQSGLNAATGDVSAAKLASQLAKGRPLTDELRTIAEFGTAFPRATQSLKEAPKTWSPLDAFAGVGGLGFGSPALLAAAAARPAARSLMLSGPYQHAALRGAGGPGLLTQAPAMLLDQELMRHAAPGLLAAPLAWATSE